MTETSEHRNLFNEFCEKYTVDSTNLINTKFISKEQGDVVIQLLKDKPTAAGEENQLKLWVRKRGFALTSYPHLGLRDVLCIPVKEEGEGVFWRRVPYIEDYYDLITKFHCCKNGQHNGVKATITELNKQYESVPKSAVEYYIQSCPVCISGRSDKSIISKSSSKACFMRKGQIELIDIHENPLGSYPHIGLYIDVWSNYHILFPLLSSPETPMEEIAVNLRKSVFPFFGIPRSLISTIGTNFVDSLLQAASIHWPDAVAISNSCKKAEGKSLFKRAKKSRLLISGLLESCREELKDVQLSSSSCADLLLSMQYQINTTADKKSCKCAYERVFGHLPNYGPQSRLLNGKDIHSGVISDSDDEDEEDVKREEDSDDSKEDDIKGEEVTMHVITKGSNIQNDPSTPSSSTTSVISHYIPEVSEDQEDSEMSRLVQKPSGQKSTQQLQQMLNIGSIQAQEHQVSSLRELLRQEESRLEMLKHMRSVPSSGGGRTKGREGIHSSDGIGNLQVSTQDTNSKPISSRLQQLVDSVAVDQLSTQATQLKQNIHSSSTLQKIQPNTSASYNGLQHDIQKFDEMTVLKTIENSRRYRDFVNKQANLKRSFQKQVDKKIAGAPYPKTFRQVWPIIPVHDSTFVKNIGLETVTMYFDPSYSKLVSPPSKIKPICNQCGCDFASAWQIRKNNSKQVLLCEACDFTNLKLFQRSKLASQLKDLVEGIRKDEEKFVSECEEARKQIIAVERSTLLGAQQKMSKSIPISIAHANHVTRHLNTSAASSIERSHFVVPSMLSSQSRVSESEQKSLNALRKRKSEEEPLTPSRKAAKTSINLDHTLNKISQQLIQKQVDEKCRQHRQRHTPSPTPRIITTNKGPPPLQQVNHSSKAVTPPVPEFKTSTPPPPLTSMPSALLGSESRKSRRKGTPRQKLLSNSSSMELI